MSLQSGKQLLIEDSYSTGAEILDQLGQLFSKEQGSNAPFQERRSSAQRYREAALNLLAPIENYRLALNNERRIGFLKALYPERADFVLPFLQVQELFTAWERYERGITLAVLKGKLHPYYGTYYPTRTVHLELFATWLSQYAGGRERAVDVGTGCGVLALMLHRAGFAEVIATDNNPNAVVSVIKEVVRRKLDGVDVLHGELLEKVTQPANLIVFNPPWIPGEAVDPFDQALYFEPCLFERFFEQARSRLTADGRVVLVYSNIGELVRPDCGNPIRKELEKGHFKLVNMMQRRVKPSHTASGEKRRTKERVQVWELAPA